MEVCLQAFCTTPYALLLLYQCQCPDLSHTLQDRIVQLDDSCQPFDRFLQLGSSARDLEVGRIRGQTGRRQKGVDQEEVPPDPVSEQEMNDILVG
jgi:hypothetical protein